MTLQQFIAELPACLVKDLAAGGNDWQTGEMTEAASVELERRKERNAAARRKAEEGATSQHRFVA